MTTIAEIEEYLNVETGDKKLCVGKHKKNKNQYYYFKDEYYIVKLSQDKWMIASDCKRTRRLLRLYTWIYVRGYTRNRKDGLYFHREVINTDDDLIAHHVNRKPFDNRVNNLRKVTQVDNMRNKSKYSNNTSGKQGVSRLTYEKSGFEFWKVQIRDNDNKRIQKYFSIKKLGDDEAKRQAIACRQQLEQEYGYLGD